MYPCTRPRVVVCVSFRCALPCLSLAAPASLTARAPGCIITVPLAMHMFLVPRYLPYHLHSSVSRPAPSLPLSFSSSLANGSYELPLLYLRPRGRSPRLSNAVFLVSGSTPMNWSLLVLSRFTCRGVCLLATPLRPLPTALCLALFLEAGQWAAEPECAGVAG